MNWIRKNGEEATLPALGMTHYQLFFVGFAQVCITNVTFACLCLIAYEKMSLIIIWFNFQKKNVQTPLEFSQWNIHSSCLSIRFICALLFIGMANAYKMSPAAS